MKKTLYGALCALALAACSTIDLSTYEDADIYAELETNNPKQVTLTVDNRGGDPFTLEQSGAAYRRDNRESPLIPVNSAGESPSRILSPGARQSWVFVAQHALNPGAGKQSIADWVPPDSSSLEFRFTYRLGGEERTLVFPDTGERTLLGKVQVAVDIALPFLKSVEDRRRKVYDQAVAQAAASFGAGGKKLRLVNLRYDSKSNGFVENVILSADVTAAD
jgi:hypothetical protein